MFIPACLNSLTLKTYAIFTKIYGKPMHKKGYKADRALTTRIEETQSIAQLFHDHKSQGSIEIFAETMFKISKRIS